MSPLKKCYGLILLICFFGSCGNVGSNEWIQFVPDETPFIIIPVRDATLQTVLNSKYLPLLDDVSSSSIALINEIDSTANEPLQIRSILLYPGTDQKLQPVWVAQAPSDFMDYMESAYEQLYGQQYYFFHNIPVLKMRTQQQMFFAAQIDDLLLLSESSLGIENAIRVWRGAQPGAELSETPLKPGSLIMNTPAVEKWIAQQSKVMYYPAIQNAFAGSGPAMLTVTQKDTTVGGGLKLTGSIPVSVESGTLIDALSAQNAPLTLDKYIPFDAAAFAFFRLPPADDFPETLIDTASVDSFFIENTDRYQQIASTLSEEFGMIFFTESGFRSINEHAFIRKVEEPERLTSLLDELANRGLAEKVEDSWFIRSFSLCRLFGSTLCNFNNFYIKIIDEVVAAAPRRGLLEMMASDYNRRQVIIYEDFYKKIKQELPEQISGMAVGGQGLLTYLQPYLKSNSYIGALTSRFDYISVAMQKNGRSVDFTLSTFNVESEEKPFIENWVFSLDAELSGPPVFADIRGSADKEIIFATDAGKVYVLAADGSVIQTFTTPNETPVGSPVAYDWYNTGQQVVMIAAGNKIYAWDESSDLLPGFPFTLDEIITTPLTVSDLNNNGLADVIVATANRRVHVLNARGEPLLGWPVETNTVINDKPLVTQYQGRTAVAAFASNAVYIWSAAGRSFSDFPRFMDASFVGAPVALNGEIIGAAANGMLYAFGENNLFDNSLDATGRQFFSGGNVETLEVSQNPLFGTPLISAEEDIAVMNAEGTVYIFSDTGVLLFTRSMGQPPAEGSIPVVTDINNDESQDIITIADYGRVYAWNIQSGERIHDLPTTALTNTTIGDIDGDELVEIVGKSEEGLHSWTIN